MLLRGRLRRPCAAQLGAGVREAVQARASVLLSGANLARIGARRARNSFLPLGTGAALVSGTTPGAPPAGSAARLPPVSGRQHTMPAMWPGPRRTQSAVSSSPNSSSRLHRPLTSCQLAGTPASLRARPRGPQSGAAPALRTGATQAGTSPTRDSALAVSPALTNSVASCSKQPHARCCLLVFGNPRT